MTRKLITILGKAQQNRDYRTANYDLTPYGGTISETAYFGLALDEHIKSDELIILGTTGSMWDNLFYQFQLEKTHSEALEELIGNIENDSVTTEQLATLAQAASAQYGKPVICDIIPYGRDEAEQTATISQILAYFDKSDRAILDVTHGLRHLPMLIEKVANLLPTLRGTEIEGIYYGALDLTPKDAPSPQTPVMQLSGLQKINQWQNALATYDRTGNIGLFSTVLGDIGVSENIIRLLEQAVLEEQTHNLVRSQESISKFLSELKQEEKNNNIIKMMLPILKERLYWIDGQKPWQREFSLAESALQYKDYLRAALYGYEAVFERILEHLKEQSADYETRKQKVRGFIQKNKNWQFKNDYWQLNNIRNFLAHGKNPREAHEAKRLEELIRDEKKLVGALKRSLKTLQETKL